MKMKIVGQIKYTLMPDGKVKAEQLTTNGFATGHGGCYETAKANMNERLIDMFQEDSTAGE
jgi:hypothetical protein